MDTIKKTAKTSAYPGVTIMKLVVNSCFGGFSLSEEVTKILGYESEYDLSSYDQRDNPKLIELMETRGSEFCSGKYAELRVVEFNEAYWFIDEYDGVERVVASDSPIKTY